MDRDALQELRSDFMRPLRLPPRALRELARLKYGELVSPLALPQRVDADLIQADYADGVIELRVTKPAGLKPKRIPLASGQKALSQ